MSVLHLVLLLDEAAPWQILVSHATEAVLEGQRLDPLELRDLGERQLRTSTRRIEYSSSSASSTAHREIATIE